MVAIKRLNRWERLTMFMRREWMTSLEQIYAIGTVTPSKVRHEMRQHGIKIKARKRSDGLTEYRVVS